MTSVALKGKCTDLLLLECRGLADISLIVNSKHPHLLSPLVTEKDWLDWQTWETNCSTCLRCYRLFVRVLPLGQCPAVWLCCTRTCLNTWFFGRSADIKALTAATCFMLYCWVKMSWRYPNFVFKSCNGTGAAARGRRPKNCNLRALDKQSPKLFWRVAVLSVLSRCEIVIHSQFWRSFSSFPPGWTDGRSSCFTAS